MFVLSDLGFARGSFGLVPALGSGKSPQIGSLELGGHTIVCCTIAACVMFALSVLGLARGSFGFAPISGLDQSPQIGLLELCIRHRALYYHSMRTVCVV